MHTDSFHCFSILYIGDSVLQLKQVRVANLRTEFYLLAVDEVQNGRPELLFAGRTSHGARLRAQTGVQR